MTQGAGFRICGSVVRKFVAPSGKIAFLTLDVFVDGRGKKVDMRGFSEMVEEIGTLNNGALVEVTGTIDIEKLTDKQRQPVVVDGREKWVTALTVRAVKTEGSSKAPAKAAPSKQSSPAADDDLPF